MSSGNTTEFVRRRIRHWKTTVAGVGAMVCPILAILIPSHADKIGMISSLFAGWGLMSAADGSNVTNQTNAILAPVAASRRDDVATRIDPPNQSKQNPGGS